MMNLQSFVATTFAASAGLAAVGIGALASLPRQAAEPPAPPPVQVASVAESAPAREPAPAVVEPAASPPAAPSRRHAQHAGRAHHAGPPQRVAVAYRRT